MPGWDEILHLCSLGGNQSTSSFLCNNPLGMGGGKGKAPWWGVGILRATCGIPGCLWYPEDPRDRNQGENSIGRSRDTHLLPSTGLPGKSFNHHWLTSHPFQTVVLLKLSPAPYDCKDLWLSLETLPSFKKKSRSFNISLPGYTFSLLLLSPECSLEMWQVVLWANEFLLLLLPLPVGPNAWILLHFIFTLSFLWLPSLGLQISLILPYHPLPQKSVYYTTSSFFNFYFISLISPRHLPDIPLLFFFHHLSDFVSNANSECPMPKEMVFPSLPHPHYCPYIKKYWPFPSTWNCPPTLLLWYYTQILSQRHYTPFTFSCSAFSEFYPHVSQWPQKDKLAKRWPRNAQGDQRRTPKHPRTQKPRNEQGRKWIPTASNYSGTFLGFF